MFALTKTFRRPIFLAEVEGASFLAHARRERRASGSIERQRIAHRACTDYGTDAGL
jgi:hypothetical protein